MVVSGMVCFRRAWGQKGTPGIGIRFDIEWRSPESEP
jgi:hypothetical protein